MNAWHAGSAPYVPFMVQWEEQKPGINHSSLEKGEIIGDFFHYLHILDFLQ